MKKELTKIEFIEVLNGIVSTGSIACINSNEVHFTRNNLVYSLNFEKLENNNIEFKLTNFEDFKRKQYRFYIDSEMIDCFIYEMLIKGFKEIRRM